MAFDIQKFTTGVISAVVAVVIVVVIAIPIIVANPVPEGAPDRKSVV